jgi:phage baseplate assembly protein W
MTANRALRFVDAGRIAEDGATGGGLATSATGALATVDGDDSVRQAIIMLLTTAPGERLMRPEYGSHLHRLVFAPNDRTTAGLAIHYVRAALVRWEPRVEIVGLDAAADPETPYRLIVSLRYRVRSSLVTEALELTIATGGPS